MTVPTDPSDLGSPAPADRRESSGLGAVGYVAVIFSSQRVDGGSVDDGYNAAAAEMDRLAAEQPGYVGIESARDDGGFGITVSYWATEADAVAWKRVAAHLAAQQAGRDRWYERYIVRIATVDRHYSWPADPA
jgi:heme-degrading monooxygenase HmoA